MAIIVIIFLIVHFGTGTFARRNTPVLIDEDPYRRNRGAGECFFIV